MIVQVPTEVIPVWYVEKWTKENAESNSALEHFLKQLIKDWHIEEENFSTQKKGGIKSECKAFN